MTLKHDIATQKISSEASATARLNRLFPAVEEASTLIAVCRPADYSASRIAMAVEDADARLLNLNIIAPETDADAMMRVEVRVCHRNPSAVARSLERYGFEVVATSAPSLYTTAEEAADRVAELLHYINL